MHFYQIICLVMGLFISNTLFANIEPIKSTGTTKVLIATPTQFTNDPEIAALGGKYILIETVTLTPEKQRLLIEHIKHSTSGKINKHSLLQGETTKIRLGMNKVPVLDQGVHGTCATFSTTAAIDALIGDDYISQLCYLELTHYLSLISSHSNGWEGNHLSLILQDLKEYGVVSKSHQTKNGCAGVFEYPVRDRKSTGNPMPLKEYTRYSKKIMGKVDTTILLSEQDAFTCAPAAVNLVSNVKKSLQQGKRVLISMLLDLRYRVGLFGDYKGEKDAWILTPEIKKDILFGDVKGRHGLVVTGFDDKAVIKGPLNTKHIGAFTVRNSWGPQAGDHGDFYISYEYFHALVFRANEVFLNP